MIEIKIPGFGDAKLAYVVSDYNGTLAHDGFLIDGVKERLVNLSQKLNVHILTADTFGRAAEQLEGLQVNVHILSQSNEDAQKAKYVNQLVGREVAVFGNGNNDRKMMEVSRLSIAVMEGEGCAVKSFMAADIVVADICAGLDLLLHPQRCKATLRY